jgi:hypothetical protein
VRGAEARNHRWFGRARDRRHSRTARPARTAMMESAISSTREWRPSQAVRWPVACKWSVAPRGLQKGPLYNRSIDTDVLSAGFARLLSAGHFQRYTDANGSASLASAVDAQALRLPRRSGAVGVQAKCAVLRPGTTAGFGRARDRRQSLTVRPARAAVMKSAISSTRELRPSQAPRGSVARRWSVAPRGLQKGPLYNRSIDTDVLSAGFARLLSAGHFQR